jgi:hypothetical protein
MPLLLVGAAWLLLVSSFLHYHVSAATLEQIEDVETLLEEMEEKVIAFGVELENAFEKRCQTDTYDTCLYSNYYDCSSKYPKQECIKADQFDASDCEDGGSSPISGDSGSSCNGEFVEHRCTDKKMFYPHIFNIIISQHLCQHFGRIKRFPRFLFHTL